MIRKFSYFYTKSSTIIWDYGNIYTINELWDTINELQKVTEVSGISVTQKESNFKVDTVVGFIVFAFL